MRTEDYILAVASNFFEVLVIWRFIRIFFWSKVEKRKEIIGYFAYWILKLAVSLMFYSPVCNLLVNWLGILLLTGMYEGTWKEKSLIGTLIFVIAAMCEVVTLHLVSDFVSVESIPQILSFFSILLTFICQILAEKIMGGLGKAKLKLLDTIMLGVPVISIIMMAFLLFENTNQRVLTLVEACGLIFINMLLFVVYHQRTMEYEEQMQRQRMEEEVRMYKNQLELIQNSHEKVRSLRHDMRHHLQLLYVMAEKGQAEKILHFLEEMMASLENPKQHITTGREEVDAILNYSWEKAEELGIDMECKVSISPHFSIRMYEISVILGNLLENAIEAAEETQKPYVSLRLLGEKDMLVLQVKNSYNGVIKRKGKQFISTKTGNGHGIGLSSVRNLVEQKQGNLQLDYDEKEFRVEVVLYT